MQKKIFLQSVYRSNQFESIDGLSTQNESTDETIGVSLHMACFSDMLCIAMKIRETATIEFKEIVTRTFLKTVSAYANYTGGEIIFGLDDGGTVIGVDDSSKEALRVEHMINDSIVPVPRFHLTVEQRDGLDIIILAVEKGKDTPYYYERRAYKRSGTSTVEVDRFELRRLALHGINMNFEAMPASGGNRTFKVLESKLKEVRGIGNITDDILRTLGLLDREGTYNVAAELLSDINTIKFSGIDIVRFGESTNQIQERVTVEGVSLLTQYDTAIEVFERYYQYEEIEGYKRTQKELIPREAFREALANAIVQRMWDIPSYIQISMFKDRLEIQSPGGLPVGLSEDEYLYGTISQLRNPIIAGVFYRLELIERFGTGVMRIQEAYSESTTKPSFDISENYLKVQLPIVALDQLDLSDDEQTALNIFKAEGELSRSALEEKTGFNKPKAIRILNSLIDKHILVRLGRGPSSMYRLR